MTQRIDIVGGIYRERCLWPDPEQDTVFGSGGRAAAALAGTGIQRVLHAYVGPDLESSIDAIMGTFDLTIEKHKRDDDIDFRYLHCLATPSISPRLLAIAKSKPIHLSGRHVIRFGMLEGDGVVDAEMCVYDPQSASDPRPFAENGSRAKRLAIVANAHELRRMANRSTIKNAAQHVLAKEAAEVVVAKCGLDGALVVTRAGATKVPAFKVDRAQTIGSGDVFVAVFSKAWMIDGATPQDAAMLASRVTADYIDFGVMPTPLMPTPREEAKPKPLKVYLAGPFFSMGQRWLIDEIRQCLYEAKLKVFSPVHDVGRGYGPDVAPKDIAAIKDCQCMLAVVDGNDTGTIFEIGYARALGRPVFVLAQCVRDEDMKMITGSGCYVSNDLPSLVTQIAQGL